MEAHIYNLSIWEVETGGCYEFQAILSYRVDSISKTNNNNSYYYYYLQPVVIIHTPRKLKQEDHHKLGLSRETLSQKGNPSINKNYQIITNKNILK